MSIPAGEFSVRKGLEKFGTHAQLALPRSWLAFAFYFADRNEPSYRF
jgi:hypothetical protein